MYRICMGQPRTRCALNRMYSNRTLSKLKEISFSKSMFSLALCRKHPYYISTGIFEAGEIELAGTPAGSVSFPTILHTILARRLCKPPFEGAREARTVLITNCARHFLDTQIGVGKEIRRSLQPSFGQQVTEGETGGLLEETLEVRITEVQRPCPVVNISQGLGINQLHEFTEPHIFDRRKLSVCMTVTIASTAAVLCPSVFPPVKAYGVPCGSGMKREHKPSL